MSERSMPPPMGNRPRTLGQARDTRPGSQRGSGPTADFAEGARDNVTDNQLQELLDQRNRLESAPPTDMRGPPRPTMPAPNEPPMPTGPNISENRVQLPADRIRTKMPTVPEDGETGRPPRTREEILADLKANRRITNEPKEGPITPPPIPARRQRADDEAPVEEKPEVYAGKPRFVLKKVERSATYHRVPLLSGFVFYDFKDLQVRKINLVDQMKLARAQAERNLTDFIDAVGATIGEGVDVRDLAIQDFRFLLYWHRFNSYTTTPFIVTWNSKYGNRNQYKIEQTNIKYNPPTMTEEEFAGWAEKGFAMPTLRDLEVFEQENLNDEERYLFNKAQWFKGRPNENGEIDLQDKIDHMAELTAEGLDILGDMLEFQDKSGFSVIEQLDLVDARFDAKAWLKQLEDRAEFLRREAELSREDNPSIYVSRMQESDEVRTEAAEIAAILEKGGEVKPDVETITLNIGLLDFFPSL